MPRSSICRSFIEEEVGQILPQDEKPVVRAILVVLAELIFLVIDVLSSIGADVELVELGEANPRFPVELCISISVRRSAEHERRSDIGPVGASSVEPRQKAGFVVGGDLVIQNMDHGLKITRHVFEQEEPIVLVGSPSAVRIGYGK